MTAKKINIINIRVVLLVLPFIVLIMLTILTFFPGRHEMPSAFLSTVTTEDANTIRSDYVDEGGRITCASDTQYATVVKTKKDGRVILEEYLDENGKPAASNNNAAAVSYSHNDRGQAECIRYLDVAGNPVVITAGYDSIHRIYNKDGLADTDTYYIGPVQVEHNDGFAGLKRTVYDDKRRPVELRYLDRDGEPRLQKNGYAMIRREYWDDTWLVKRDLYFDVDGRPVGDRDGKFGYYREYDDKGREVLTTYLDADGEPLDVKAGYATIRTSYVKDDGVCAIKKLYYDKDASPATIGRYQYGTETVDGRTYYLNADGSRMLRIDNLVSNEPLLVMVVGVVLAVLAVIMNGRGRSLLAFISIGIIVVMTLSFRRYDPNRRTWEVRTRELK